MATFTLECFAQSGNAYKAALLLALTKADWKPEFVDFFNGGARTPVFLAKNAMGEVPVLHHDEKTLTQSAVILDYLSRELDAFRIDTDEDTRLEAMRWLFWDNHKLTNYTATLRFLLNFANTGDTPVTEFMTARRNTAFKVLERQLAQRTWIVGDKPTIVDLSCSGYLFWPDELNVDFAADWPAINAWLSRIKALDGWSHPYDLMPGHPIPS
ncbi:MAG: glutathione S-transferase family protein [Pseudomonadota bacterium]